MDQFLQTLWRLSHRTEQILRISLLVLLLPLLRGLANIGIMPQLYGLERELFLFLQNMVIHNIFTLFAQKQKVVGIMEELLVICKTEL